MTTTARSSRLRAVSRCALCLWLTAACAAAARAPPAPRPLTGPEAQAAVRGPEAAAAAAPDRSLHIRSIPELKGYSSNLYEVLMQPYHFAVPALTAVSTLAAAGEAEAGGELMLWQPHPPVGPLIVAGNLTGLPAGAKLLLQVKMWGDTREGCDASTGPPYDPFGPAVLPAAIPGLPPPPPPLFLGDVGVVEAGEDGSARVHMVSHALGLSGAHSVLGRALALRPLPPPPAPGAKPPADGDAAPAAQADAATADTIACGVIALTKYQPLPPPPPPPMPPAPPKNPDAEAVEAERLNRP